MSTDRLVTPLPQPGEESVQVSLRPSRLADYVGQEEVKRKLSIAVQASRQREEPLEHTLLYGPPGLGKTTLAHIISHEMGGGLVCSSGPAIERGGDLLGLLTNLQAGDIFFIDEIHRLPRVVEELLYSAMEDFRLDFVVDKGAFARTIKVGLKRFTLVGATTRAGQLSAPLRERFGLVYHLDFYPPGELSLIVSRSANLLGVGVEPDAATLIAERSRGTPRIANRLLRRVRDYAQVEGHGTVTMSLTRQALELEGIDDLGLDEMDRRFLATIIDVYRGGPVGIEALAATLNEEADTLRDMVEPFLLKAGLLARTPSGRRITPGALQHLGYPVTDTGQGSWW